MKKYWLMLFAAGFLSFSSIAQSTHRMKDSRDNQVYTTVRINSITYMAENLRYKAEKGSSCYDDKEENCKKYGRLYDWETAKTVCPEGWHLPSNEEWQSLIAVFSDKKTAYTDLIEGGRVKFNSEMAGVYDSNKSSYNGKDEAVIYWSSTPYEFDDSKVSTFSINKLYKNIYNTYGEPLHRYCVRCIRD